MKKLRLKYTFTFLIFAFSVIGQTTESVFIFKPVIGMNACQIHGDAASGYNKPGLTGGVVINSRLSKKLSLDLGFLYSQKGAWKNQNTKNGDYSFFRIDLDYIELPLLLNVKANSKYFITLGPSVAYLFNYSANINGINYSDLYNFNKFEYAVSFGLGRTLKGKWLVEVRTNNSFLPILNYGQTANLVFFPNPVARFFNKGLYNNILSAYIIYEIHPKKKSEPIQP
ncbi:MAG: PorT family protein [Bacteroidia bacterium]|jgi:Outer membrane protein beta-barrel domain|nr:PorT family protein [Sphingobacteriaceae bacterium]MBK7818158.1 PorT family protein [Sphingobacteriaceae bacterium]MBP9069315.1 PorT family protein [Bacteroidia bacterium]